MRESNRVRVFYPNEESRDMAWIVLDMLSYSMAEKAEEAQKIIDQYQPVGKSTGRPAVLYNAKISQALTDAYRCLMSDPKVYKIDDFVESQGIYGIDMNERLFWEGYVIPNDISRPKGSKYETGRPSMPEFQQMNIETLREGEKRHPDECRPVLWHGDCGRIGEAAPEASNPLCPKGLLMAYQENMKVMPVVSDFDCFLLGTRGVRYHEPLGEQELSMLNHCVDEIEGILSTPREGSNWTTRWLEVKMKHMQDDSHKEEMPPFGYADPRSYKMMTGAVLRLKDNGAVRHGPECFNYGFPQDLDDEYLVVSDTFPGVPWRYANPKELIDILCQKIDEGFTFPMNPKWILADSGWKAVYDKLMASQKPNVQESMDIWYPPEVRNRIRYISTNFPNGFVATGSGGQSSGVQADLAALELRRYKVRMEARRKVRNALRRGMMVKEIMGDAFEFTETPAEPEPPKEEHRPSVISLELDERYYPRASLMENEPYEFDVQPEDEEVSEEPHMEVESAKEPEGKKKRSRKFINTGKISSKLNSVKNFIRKKSSI
jgi:hypothetical protein